MSTNRGSLHYAAKNSDNKTNYYNLIYYNFIVAESNPDVLFDYLGPKIKLDINRAQRDPKGVSKIYAWSWSYLAEACIEGYKHTGNQDFLDLFVNSFDIIQNQTDVHRNKTDYLRGRPLYTWGYEMELTNQSDAMTYNMRIIYPVLKFSQIILNNQKLKEKYGKKASEYLNISERKGCA